MPDRDGSKSQLHDWKILLVLTLIKVLKQCPIEGEKISPPSVSAAQATINNVLLKWKKISPSHASIISAYCFYLSTFFFSKCFIDNTKIHLQIEAFYQKKQNKTKQKSKQTKRSALLLLTHTYITSILFILLLYYS